MHPFLRTTLASALLLSAVLPAQPAKAQMCMPSNPCGDVNASGTVNAADALLVLKAAVGQPVTVQCACEADEASLWPATPLVTGQIACYDPQDIINPIAPIDCPGSKQDGDFLRGIPFSHVDNLDGTISDLSTGLMWEVLTDDSTITDWKDFSYQWEGALQKIRRLNDLNDGFGLAGYQDWRLPNLRELQTLVNYGRDKPAISTTFHRDCAAGCVAGQCACTVSGNYWSSTTNGSSLGQAWVVNFTTGTVAAATKTGYNYVRAVRDIQ